MENNKNNILSEKFDNSGFSNKIISGNNLNSYNINSSNNCIKIDNDIKQFKDRLLNSKFYYNNNIFKRNNSINFQETDLEKSINKFDFEIKENIINSNKLRLKLKNYLLNN